MEQPEDDVSVDVGASELDAKMGIGQVTGEVQIKVVKGDDEAGHGVVGEGRVVSGAGLMTRPGRLVLERT